jgi:hypothetical protein
VTESAAQTSPIHLLVFGEGGFNLNRSAKRLAREARKSRLFASVTILDGKYLNQFKDFWIPFNDFVKKGAEKGYGHWAWKPFIIKNFINQIPSGEILMYLDAGCVLNFRNIESVSRFNYYINLVEEHGSLAFRLVNGMYGAGHRINLTENNLGDPELIAHLECENFRDTNQIEANVILLKKNVRNLEFSEKWYFLCSQDNFFWLDDSRRRILARQKFYQFDQAIFSLLWKKSKFTTLDQETYFADNTFVDRGANYPIWTMRHKFGYHPFESSTRDSWEVFLSNFMNNYGIVRRSFIEDRFPLFALKVIRKSCSFVCGRLLRVLQHLRRR